MSSPDQRRSTENQAEHHKKHGDEGQRKPDDALPIEKDPCHQHEPGNKAGGNSGDVGVKLIECWTIMGDEFFHRESYL